MLSMMHNMFEIRIADISDLKTLQRLGYELLRFEHDNWDSTLDLAWPYSPSGEAIYRQAILHKYTILAYLDNNPVGYLIGTVQTPPVSSARSTITAQLNNIYVCESARHSGIGHALVDNFYQYCANHQVDNINVTVNTANQSAINFYEQEGFLPSRLILTQKIKPKN